MEPEPKLGAKLPRGTPNTSQHALLAHFTPLITRSLQKLPLPPAPGRARVDLNTSTVSLQGTGGSHSDGMHRRTIMV